MKKLIYKIALFVTLYLVISSIISLITPYHWGNPWYSTKIQYLEKLSTTDLPDTYFFGSSRVFRQINPCTFDSIFYQLTKKKIHSFNLGAPATFCPQTYYLYENFLKSDLTKNVKTVFIELMGVDSIGETLMHQERTTYWQNVADLKFVLSSAYNNPNLSNSSKRKYFHNYLISYFECLLHVGHFGQQLIVRDYYNKKYLGQDKDGFYPLEYDIITTTDKNILKDLITRKKSLEKYYYRLPKMIKVRKNYDGAVTNKYDKINMDRILELIKLSKDRNIQLIFILSPRHASQELVNMLQVIPQENKIDMSDGKKYPQLYAYENSFDLVHLNTKGAELYSMLLVKEFIKIK